MTTKQGVSPRGEWHPDSWQDRPAAQQPVYPDPDALQAVLKQLSQLPPLVTSWEVEALKQQLAEAVRGQRFLLQGGDCSESFEDCSSGSITAKLKILLQMSIVLVQGSKRRVIRVGRFAGQYAKPRSMDMETREGITLPSFRGDMINRPSYCAPTSAPA
jgi:3-deoxy-7-phosphoheptulonate synthase